MMNSFGKSSANRRLHLRWGAIIAALVIAGTLTRMACLRAEDDTPVAEQHWRNVRIERMELIERTPVDETPVTIHAADAGGERVTFEAVLFEHVYDMAWTAIQVLTGEEGRWHRPSLCVIVEPADPAIEFEWAFWPRYVTPERGPQARLYTDITGQSYASWVQLGQLMIMKIDRPRPIRQAFKQEGFSVPQTRRDAIFDVFRDAPADAWGPRLHLLQTAPAELVSVHERDGAWDLTVRNTRTEIEYRFRSPDGFKWQQMRD